MAKKDSGKAFKKKSLVGKIAKVFVAVCVLIALIGVGVRFALPNQWNQGVDHAEKVLDIPLLRAFETISDKYVDNASDLDGDGKRAWKDRLGKMAETLRGKKGSGEARKDLRAVYKAIVADMQDGDLTGAELEPRREELEKLLEKIETEEVQKKQ